MEDLWASVSLLPINCFYLMTWSVVYACYFLQLLHKVFTAWYGQVVQRRQQYSRVCATLNWRRLFRLWTRWQGALRTRQLKREEQEAARLVIREKR